MRMRFVTAVACLVLAVLPACGGGGGGGSGGGGGPPPGATMSAAELADAMEVLRLVNVERANNVPPLAALTWDDNAGQAAYLHSLDMDVRGKQYYLMPGKLIEGGDDFDLASFKVMQRE